MSDENVFGLIPEAGAEASGEKPTQPAPETQEQDAKETEAPSPAPEPAPQPDPAPEPAKPEGEGEEEEDGISEDGNGFRIGNKVYKDILAADHAFRQATGRASAESRRANSLSRERDELLKRIAVLEAQTSSHTPQNATEAPPTEAPAQERKRLTERLDRDQLNELIAEEGADAAIAKMLETVEEWATETLDARTAPLRKQEEVAEAQRIAMEAFETVAAAEQDGQALFPELRDENIAPQIVATWDQLIVEDPDFRAIALSPAGAKFAYAVWRMNNGGGQPSQPASDPRPAARPAPGPTAASTREGSLQQMGSGQRAPSVAPGSSTQSPAATEEAVRQLIAAKTHPIFGVSLS